MKKVYHYNRVIQYKLGYKNCPGHTEKMRKNTFCIILTYSLISTHNIKFETNRDWLPKFATGLNCLNKHRSKNMSDHSVLLPKWFTHGGITLAKGQNGYSYTFWSMPI